MVQVHEFGGGGYVVHGVEVHGGRASVWLDAKMEVVDVEYFNKHRKPALLKVGAPSWRHVVHSAKQEVSWMLTARNSPR